MKARYDCSKCPGYCCSYDRIEVSDFDIARLAKHFGLSADAARAKFTFHHKTKDADEWVLRRLQNYLKPPRASGVAK